MLQSPLELALGPVNSGSRPEIADARQFDEIEYYGVFEPEIEDVDVRRAPRVSVDRDLVAYRPAPVVKRFRSEAFSERRPVFNTSPRQLTAKYSNTPRAASPSDFKTVVIRYDDSSRIPDCDKFATPKPRKRSFAAKAAPVIKKPWEWMKTVASKFN
jgi:hypothetical protein